MEANKHEEKQIPINDEIISNINHHNCALFYHAHGRKLERECSYQFLIQNLPVLQSSGVTDICLELTPREFDFLNHLSPREAKEQNVDDKFNFIKKAQAAGFTIQPIDTHQHDKTTRPGTKERTVGRHRHMKHTVETLLRDGKKIAVLLGAAHIKLSEQLAMPGIVLAPENAVGGTIEDYFDNYLASRGVGANVKFKHTLEYNTLDTDLNSDSLHFYKALSVQSTISHCSFFQKAVIGALAVTGMGIAVYQALKS